MVDELGTREKPLHVRVAEALGWREGAHAMPEWVGDRPIVAWGYAPTGGHTLEPPPRYDLDWAATGPLVERFGIGLARMREGSWFACKLYNNEKGFDLEGATPLLAICNLILVLAAEEKLPK